LEPVKQFTLTDLEPAPQAELRGPHTQSR